MLENAKLLCTTIAIENIDEARALFTGLLGFTAPESGPLAAPKPIQGAHAVQYAFLQRDGRFIELVQPSSGPRLEMLKKRGPGPYMLNFTVPDIEPAAKEFTDKNMPLLNPFGDELEKGRFHMTGTGSRCFFAYVAGVYVEVIEGHKE